MPFARKALFSCLLYGCLFYSKIAFAGPPFITEDPEILAPDNMKGILYALGNSSSYLTSVAFPAVETDFGIVRNLEVDAFIPYVTNLNAPPYLRDQFPNATGMGDISIEFKYRFIQQDSGLQISFVPLVYFPTGDARQGLGNGRTWYQFPISIEKSLNDWKAIAEGGYTLNSAPGFNHFLFAGLLLQKDVTSRLNLGGELFAQGGSTDATRGYTLLNLGGTFLWTQHVALLFSAGHSILGQQTWAGYLGMAISS